MSQSTFNSTNHLPSQPTQLPAPTSSRFSPLARAIQKGIWIVAQIYVFLRQLVNSIGILWQKYKQLVFSLVAIAFTFALFKVVLAAVNALNDIPLVAPTFELVGIGYSIWFFQRYLLLPSTRQEFLQQIHTFLNPLLKELTPSQQQEQSYQQSEIPSLSDQSQVGNISQLSQEPQIYQQVEEANTTIQNKQQLYKPGEIVPISGQYEVISPSGISAQREVTSTKGEHFPPTSESGMHYKLVDQTIHKNN